MDRYPSPRPSPRGRGNAPPLPLDRAFHHRAPINIIYSIVKQPRRDDRYTVIASASEAIHAATGNKEWIASSLRLPCANASRLSQAKTWRHNSAFSRRDAPELCWDQPARRGRGEGRVLAAPVARLQTKSRRQSPQVQPIIRPSPRNGFNGFLRALPSDRAFLPLSPAESLPPT